MSTLNQGVDTLSSAMNPDAATPPARRSPRIIALPPLVFAAALLVGITASALIPSPFIPGGHNPALRIPSGVLFIALGGLLARWAHKNFLRHGTNALPWRPTNALVSSGPYRFTRNPMYLAMAIASFGVAIAAGSFYALLMLIPAIFLVHRHAIRREEAFLTQKFGEDYLTYKRSVRRWI